MAVRSIFGNDGKLYFTTGEHFAGTPSQDLSSPRGKIHRIDKDGFVPLDNPFYDGAGPNWDSVWAYGLRNPFRAYFDAPTNRLYIGDVGGNVEQLERGAQPRRARRQLRLAGLRRTVLGALHEPAVRLRAQRAERLDHGWLRLPRDAVPELDAGELLLRRLRAALDQAADVRCQRQRRGRLQLRAHQRQPERVGRRRRLPHRRAGRRAVLRGSRLLRHHGHVRRQQDPPDPLPPVEPGAGRARLGQPDLGSRAARGELLQRRLERPRGPADHLLLGLRRRHLVDGEQSRPHVCRGRPVRRAADGLRRRQQLDLDAAEHQRRERADGDDRLADRWGHVPRRRRDQLRRRRDATSRTAPCPPAPSPGRSTSCTTTTSIRPSPPPASSRAPSPFRRPATTSRATPAIASR